MAYLRHGGAFHIHRQHFGKVFPDGFQLRGILNELVAGANQAPFYIFMTYRLQQFGGCRITGRKSLHLSVFVARAAIHIVIDAVIAGHHIPHFQASVHAAGHARINQRLRRVFVFYQVDARGGRHLADARFHQNHFLVGHTPRGQAETR